MKILTIIGARPQFIKAGAVSRAIKQYNSQITNHQSQITNHQSLITEVIVHTGQHYDKNMSDIFFEELHIPKPDYFLGIGGKSHGAMTGEMIVKLEEIMLKEKPDIVLVYGDTNSTLAGAIAASKLHIPIAHVEAGLRSFNMKMPEEINRILTDRVSKWLFCPTDTAVENLKKEGYFIEVEGRRQKVEGFGKVINVGDVMLDAAMYYKQFAKKPSTFNLQPSAFILCTIHRAENTDDPQRLKNIIEALNEIAKDTQIILPLHPRTRKIVSSFWSLVDGEKKGTYYITTNNQKPKTKNLIIIDPVGYLEMVWLLEHCSLVMTDSGGLQKEAYFFEKPCITLRDETEWIELIENGFNVLAGADKDKIINVYKNFNFNENYDINLYGNGIASKNIYEELIHG